MYLLVLFSLGCAMAVSISRILGVLCLWSVLLGGVLLLACFYINKLFIKHPFFIRTSIVSVFFGVVFFAEKCAEHDGNAALISLCLVPLFVLIATPILLTCSMIGEGV